MRRPGRFRERDSGTAMTGSGRKAGSVRGGRFLMVVAGASILAAGCGTTMAPVVDLSAAVTHTGDLTARVAVTTSVQSPGMSISFTEAGVFDFAYSRGMLSSRNPVGMTEIFVPPKAYIKMPGGAPGLPRGKSWIAVDVGTSAGLGTSPLTAFGGSTDPADLLASLTAVSSSVTKLSTSTIRGVPVTEFRVRIDPAKAAARLPGWERAGFLEFARSLGSGAIPVDVWLDGQNLVRQVTLSLTVPGGPAGTSPPATPSPLAGPGAPAAPADPGAPADPAGLRLVESTDFYDFGVPVRVSAPPAAQVESQPEAISGLSGSAGESGSPPPPPVTGTLSPAQAAAAEHVVAAFWSALGHDRPAAVAQTVRPAERSCVRSFLSGDPKITVTSFRPVSAKPAGNGLATVRFTVKARATLGGQTLPVFPQGPRRVQWLVTLEVAGHWYVDLARSGASMMGGPCS